jgi:Mg-chelatase subunit ChlI
VQAYLSNPRILSAAYAEELQAAASEIRAARQRLPKVSLSKKAAQPAIQLVQKLGIDSLRAEITWFEAARAYAAADGRTKVVAEDLQAVAPMALRLRRSQFMTEYFANQGREEEELSSLLSTL